MLLCAGSWRAVHKRAYHRAGMCADLWSDRDKLHCRCMAMHACLRHELVLPVYLQHMPSLRKPAGCLKLAPLTSCYSRRRARYSAHIHLRLTLCVCQRLQSRPQSRRLGQRHGTTIGCTIGRNAARVNMQHKVTAAGSRLRRVCSHSVYMREGCVSAGVTALLYCKPLQARYMYAAPAPRSRPCRAAPIQGPA